MGYISKGGLDVFNPYLQLLHAEWLKYGKQAYKVFALFASPAAVAAYGWKKVKSFKEKRRLARDIAQAEITTLEDSQLVTIAGSQVEFETGQLRFIKTRNKLVLPFPAEQEQAMSEVISDFQFHEPQWGDLAESMLRDLKKHCGDPKALLELAADATAKELVARAAASHRIFNGTTYHAFSLVSSADKAESPTVDVCFYETDFFTTRVLHHAFLNFRAGEGEALDLSDDAVRNDLRLLWNGFGLNCLVCAVKPHAQTTDHGVLVFGRRSQRVSKGASTGKWHVTANEALSGGDVVDQTFSLDHFVKRSLKEEVGLTDNQVKRIYFLNVGIVLTDLQPCLMALVFCEVENVNELLHRAKGSQDGSIEYDRHAVLPFTDQAIQNALDCGGLQDKQTKALTNFSPTASSILRGVAARRCRSFTLV